MLKAYGAKAMPWFHTLYVWAITQEKLFCTI